MPSLTASLTLLSQPCLITPAEGLPEWATTPVEERLAWAITPVAEHPGWETTRAEGPLGWEITPVEARLGCDVFAYSSILIVETCTTTLSVGFVL